MFFVSRLILSWAIWIIFADTKRWRALIPTSIFAVFLSLIVDLFNDEVYTLWSYHGANHFFIHFTEVFGIYAVVVYLFIQYLPKRPMFWNMFKHIIIWTSIAVVIEYVHIATNHMEYHRWWNLKWSCFSDVILFFVFYKFYKMLNFEKLT